MTAPMWAALASLLVACAGPLQHALEEHMKPVKEALTAAGNCSIPLTLVVLGAYFHVPQPKAESCGPAEASLARTLTACGSNQSLAQGVKRVFDFGAGKHPHNSRDGAAIDSGNTDGHTTPGETKTVVVAVLSRMVLTPLILLPLLAILIAADAHQIFKECVL